MIRASCGLAVATIYPQLFLNWTYLDASDPSRRPLRGNLDRLIEIARLDEEEPAKLLLALCKGAVSNREFATPNAHGRCGARTLKCMCDDQQTALSQSFDIVQGFLPQSQPLAFRKIIDLCSSSYAIHRYFISGLQTHDNQGPGRRANSSAHLRGADETLKL